MRRTALVPTLAVAAVLLFAAPALALGPGGWDHAGTGATSTVPSLNGAVYALNADDPGVLLVGGSFTSAGGNAKAARIATWNGSAWGAIGPMPISNGNVNAIAYHAGKVYAGGTFQNAGGNSDADFLAVNDGTGWAPACTATGPAITATVSALVIIGSTLYVGGSFANAGGLAAADFLVACDLSTGTPSALVGADGDINGGVLALAADSNGVLYAGGQFSDMNHILDADHVAAYDGAWHAMGSGPSAGGGAVDSYVRSMAANGTDVYIGTDSVDVAGVAAADHVAKWNGSSWSALGSNTAGTDGWFPATAFIYALSALGAQVFAAGSFQNANGIATADGVAYFDGSAWHPIGSNGAGNGPLNANVTAISTFRTAVYAGGSFTSAGGDVRAQGIARFDLKLPDARIGLASAGPFAGNSVYSTTAAGESKTRTVTRGKSGTFYVSIQNDGLQAAAFTVKGTGSARGFTVRYYKGGTSVTTAVKAGTWSTGTIAPGAAVTLRVVVSLATSTATSATYLVKVSSVSGTPADAVKAIVKAK